MRALVQRVTRAEVDSRPSADADWEVAGSIGPGLCVLVGVTHSDTTRRRPTSWPTSCWDLRVFDDDDGVMNRSVADVRWICSS